MGYDQIKKKINIQLIRWELLEKKFKQIKGSYRMFGAGCCFLIALSPCLTRKVKFEQSPKGSEEVYAWVRAL